MVILWYLLCNIVYDKIKSILRKGSFRGYNEMIDGTQVIDDPTELVAEFMPITIWSVGEENTVNFVLPPGFEEKEADWIGVFKVSFFLYFKPSNSNPLIFLCVKEHFTSLDKYQAWEYTGRDEHERNRQRSQRRELKVTFPDSVSLREGRNYRLLYFQSTGTRGVTGLAGIGEPFPVQKRARTPGPDDVDWFVVF